MASIEASGCAVNLGRACRRCGCTLLRPQHGETMRRVSEQRLVPSFVYERVGYEVAEMYLKPLLREAVEAHAPLKTSCSLFDADPDYWRAAGPANEERAKRRFSFLGRDDNYTTVVLVCVDCYKKG